MNLPKKILVPVDFNGSSERALDYAVGLAHLSNAEITVMHAYELPVWGFSDPTLIATPDLMGRIATAAQNAVANVVESHQNEGVVVKGLLKQDEPSRAISQAAEELGADLIVMGTHGRHGIAHALLGSVAEKVVRTAPCAVLTIREGKGAN